MEIVDGTVIAMHGPLVRVQVEQETLVVASRRRLNWEGGTPASARLVVGDWVTVEMQGEDGVIIAVHARRNCLQRKAPSKNRAQLLAANVDQALLVFGIIMLLFGAKKLPLLARGLGSGIRNFKGELQAPPDEEDSDELD